jgi:hypothetical protein
MILPSYEVGVCVGTAIRFQGVCSSAIVKEAIENFYAIHDLLPSLLGEF